MNALQIGIITFVLIWVGALIGVTLNPLVQRHHPGLYYKELLTDTINVTASLTAVTLGLLIAQSIDSFQQKTDELKKQASSFIALDRILLDYGPAATKCREENLAVIADEIDRIKLAADGGALTHFGNAPLKSLRQLLLDLEPENPNQIYLKTKALDLTQQLVSSRWFLYEHLGSTLQWPLIVVLIFWLFSIFVTLGLKGRRHWLSIGLLFISTIPCLPRCIFWWNSTRPIMAWLRSPLSRFNRLSSNSR